MHLNTLEMLEHLHLETRELHEHMDLKTHELLRAHAPQDSWVAQAYDLKTVDLLHCSTSIITLVKLKCLPCMVSVVHPGNAFLLQSQSEAAFKSRHDMELV